MKNIILYCLAAASLTLSFCFEKMPDASASAGRSTSGVPAQAEASLLPALADSEPRTPPTAEPAKALSASRDSLVYGYYAQTLGVRLAYNENKDLLQTVTDWMGTPYAFGSNSRRGTDCSGFVTRVYKEVYGITLQRSSRSMFSSVKHVAKSQLKTGDLVFFRRGPHQPIYHVGIYLKDGKFIHSATVGGVMVSSLRQPYYQRNFYAAGRVNTPAPATPAPADANENSVASVTP